PLQDSRSQCPSQRRSASSWFLSKCSCYRRTRQPTRKLKVGGRPSRSSHQSDYHSVTHIHTPVRPSSAQTGTHSAHGDARLPFNRNSSKEMPCAGFCHAVNCLLLA